MKVLIDTVSINDPGLLSIQDDLINSVIKGKDENSEIIIIQKANNPIILNDKKIKIINVKPNKLGWFGKWFWLNNIVPKIIKKHKINVYYTITGLASKAIKNKCAILCSVNNMAPFSNLLKKYYSRFSIDRLRLNLLKFFYIQTCEISSALVLHSKFAKDKLEPFIKDISKKTTICYTGIPSLIRDSIIDKGLHPYNGEEYFFYLSSMLRYKNHINLIKGYETALQKNSEIPDLLIAGYAVEKRYVQEIKDIINQPHLSERVKYIGTIPKQEKKSWLHYATANFFPSLCETNSVVLAEIVGSDGVMACSDIPPMSEIMGPAAVLFNPFDESSIAEKFLLLTENKSIRRELLELSQKHAELFSWENCGNQIWEAAKHAYINRKY